MADEATRTMAGCHPRAEAAPPAQKIPALLHQTFETFEIPAGMQAAAQTWIARNPAYEHRYHDAVARRSLLAQHFDADTVAAYDKLSYGAFKADLWRYCQLYVTGGVYIDIDTICRTDLRDIIAPQDEFVVPGTGGVSFAVFNAFIASVPGHPFMAQAVERAVRAVLETPEGDFDGYMMTGPGALGQTINVVLGRDAQAEHTTGHHVFADGSYRIIEKRRDSDGDRKVFDGDRVVFDTKYEGYLDDLSSTGAAHWADAPPTTKQRLKRAAKRFLAPFRA